MLANVTFYNDQELPTTDLIWRQPDGTSLYDFSSGWTFSLRLARVTAPATTLLLKTTGITGASTSPNLSIAWSTSDWSGLEASTLGTKYVGAVYARRTADSYDMAANISVTLKAAPGTSAVSPSSYPVTVTAASVTLADTGGHFTATDVEGALAEIPTEYTSNVTKPLGLRITQHVQGYTFLAFGLTAGEVYAVRNSSLVVSKSTDGGATFTDGTAPNATFAPTHGWVTSTGALLVYPNETTTPRLYRSTNGGTSWSTVFTFATNERLFANGLVEHTDGKLYMAEYHTDTGIASGKVYVSSDDGATWSLHSSIPTTGAAGPNRVRHLHGMLSGSTALWLFTGDSSSESGFWTYSGSAWVRQTPYTTDDTAHKWCAVSAQERSGYLYWALDTNGDDPGAVYKAPITDLSAAVKLCDLPSSFYYSAKLPNGNIVFGSANEDGGTATYQDNMVRLVAVDANDHVYEVWRGLINANKTSTNLPVYNVKASTDNYVGFTPRELDYHTIGGSVTSLATGKLQRGYPASEFRKPPRPAYPAKYWQTTATTSSPTTTQTNASTPDTLSEMTLTVYSSGLPVEVIFTGSFAQSATNVTTKIGISINGALPSTLYIREHQATAAGGFAFSLNTSGIFELPVGLNTVSIVWWLSSAGTGTARLTERNMTIKELAA